jgi:copper homeostasis protein
MRSILEIIACSLEDAGEAEAGGAGRLEIIDRPDLGGLTPAVDVVEKIAARVSIPIRVMLRESESYTVRSRREIERLTDAAKTFESIGVDGVVLGFTRENSVDPDLTAEVLDFVPNIKATFHHAFESTDDKTAAIEAIRLLPQIDRILSHGGAGKWNEKYELVDSYARLARPQLEIIAGGGVDAEAIRLLRESTSIREFHAGTAARTNGKVDRARVRELVRALEAN